MAVSFLDNIAAARLLTLLNIPFTSWKAYELGIIDGKGDTISKADTPDKRAAWTYLHRVIRKIKKLMDRVPGARIAASIYALRESSDLSDDEFAMLSEAIVAGESSNIFAGTNTGAVVGKGPTKLKKFDEFLSESTQINGILDELELLVSTNTKLNNQQKQKFIDRFASVAQHSHTIKEVDIDRFEQLLKLT